MNKAQELLSVVASIAEDMGPLNLDAGAKVTVNVDGEEHPGTIAQDAEGKVYNADQNAYYVQVEGGAAWVPVAELKVAESKVTTKTATKPTGTLAERLASRLAKKNEDDAPMAGQGTGEPSAAAAASVPSDKDPMIVMQDAYECMVTSVDQMREAYMKHKGYGEEAPPADDQMLHHLDGLGKALGDMGEYMNGSLSIPVTGASRGGTMQSHPGSAPASAV